MAENNRQRVRRGFMGGGGHMRGPVEKPKDLKGTVKKLWGYLAKYKIPLFFVIIFAVLSTAFSIIGPKKLGDATTIIYNGVMNIIANNGQGMDFAGIRNIMLWLIRIIFNKYGVFISAGTYNGWSNNKNNI